MDFLDRIYLDNDVRSYLIVLGTILIVFALRRLLSRHAAGLIHTIVRRYWKNLPREEFINLIIRPLGWFISFSVAIVALGKLTFPSAWDMKFFGHPLDIIISKAGVCLLIFAFTWLVIGLVNFFAYILEQKALQTAEKSDEQLVSFIRDFLKVIIIIGGILMTLKAGFNQDIGTVLTGLSIVGAALALAAKESLENLIASFIIFFNKPFFTGDLLKVNQVMGTVENIGLRSTRIRTADKTLITVPNKQMVDSVVDNWSMRTHRRAEIKLQLAADTSIQQLQDLLERVREKLSSEEFRFTSQQAIFSEISQNGYQLFIEFMTESIPLNEFNAMKEEVNFFLVKLMHEMNIRISEQSQSKS